MNSKKIDLQKKRCREEWFKNHRARLFSDMASDPHGATIIDWSNPESWNFGCRFIIHRRWLIIVGDIGEATYEWGQDLNLEFLSRLDFHYFHGKCRASETGGNYWQWDSEEAYHTTQKLLTEFDQQNPAGEKDDWRSTLRDLTKDSPKDEFEIAVHRAYNEGADTMDISRILESGLQPHCRAVGHFVGLQMAIEQLESNA